MSKEDKDKLFSKFPLKAKDHPVYYSGAKDDGYGDREPYVLLSVDEYEELAAAWRRIEEQKLSLGFSSSGYIIVEWGDLYDSSGISDEVVDSIGMSVDNLKSGSVSDPVDVVGAMELYGNVLKRTDSDSAYSLYREKVLSRPDSDGFWWTVVWNSWWVVCVSLEDGIFWVPGYDNAWDIDDREHEFREKWIKVKVPDIEIGEDYKK